MISFYVGFLVHIILMFLKKTRFIICLIVLYKTWWLALDQHEAIEMWQSLQYNSSFKRECLQIASNCAKFHTNKNNTFANGFILPWAYFNCCCIAHNIVLVIINISLVIITFEYFNDYNILFGCRKIER